VAIEKPKEMISNINHNANNARIICFAEKLITTTHATLSRLITGILQTHPQFKPKSFSFARTFFFPFNWI